MSGDGGGAAGFPQARLAHVDGGLPVEVTLIARLATGMGDVMIREAAQRQRTHPGFVDAHDEPSACLGAMHNREGDCSTLFSFFVGHEGHPFHRHAGHRMFTAIAGSGGARLLFSTASDQQGFIASLRQVIVPPDAWFSVRFGGGTWHRFMPSRPGAAHPTLFALSCHPDETAGALTDAQRDAVFGGSADLPTLTELLSPGLSAQVDALSWDSIPTTELRLPSVTP